MPIGKELRRRRRRRRHTYNTWQTTTAVMEEVDLPLEF
jgi:hypothetical protein